MAQDDLGTWLVRQGELTAERLEDVFQHQVIYGGALDTNILEMSLMAEDTLLTRLGQYLNLPTVNGATLKSLDPDKLRLFPQKLAQKYGAAPFKVEGRNLFLALNTPPDLSTLDDIGFMLSVYIRPFAALEVRLAQALLRTYGLPLAARMENLLAQIGEDADEDRAFFEKRKGPSLLPLDKPGAVPPPLPRAAQARPPSKPPPLPVDARRPTPVRGTPGAAAHPPSSPPISSELPTPTVLPSAREVWVAEERARKERPSAAPHSSLPPPLPKDAGPLPADVLEAQAAVLAASDADLNPTALSPLLSGEAPPPPAAAALDELPPSGVMPDGQGALPVEADPVFDDPDAVARIQRRAEKVTWRLADARAEFAMAASRDDVVEVLLRFAWRALEYAAVFVLQGKQFTGWDSIGVGEVPRALSRVRISPAPGTALGLVEQTNSHYLGPLKPNDPLPAAVGRAHPKVALLVPFSVKGRLVGVLYGERGQKTIPPRAVSDLQSLTSDVGRTLEALILKTKRERLGFVDARPADASASIRDALREPQPAAAPPDAAPPAAAQPSTPPLPPVLSPALPDSQPPPLPAHPHNATTPPTPAALNLLYAEAARAQERGESLPPLEEPPHTPSVPVVVPQEARPSGDFAAMPQPETWVPEVQQAGPPIPADQMEDLAAAAPAGGATAPVTPLHEPPPTPAEPVDLREEPVAAPPDAVEAREEPVVAPPDTLEAREEPVVAPVDALEAREEPVVAPVDALEAREEPVVAPVDALEAREEPVVAPPDTVEPREEPVVAPQDEPVVATDISALHSAAHTAALAAAAPPPPSRGPPVLPPPQQRPGATDVLLDAAPADWGSWQPAAAAEKPAAPAAAPSSPGGPPPLPRRKETQQLFSAPATVQQPPAQAAPPPVMQPPPIPPPAAPPPPAPAPSAPAPTTLPPAAANTMVEVREATERHAASLLEQVPGATGEGLHKLAQAIFKTDHDPQSASLLERAVGRTREATAAQEMLAGHKGLATAAALRLFPGPLLLNLFSEEGGAVQDVKDVSPLCRVLLRLGDDSVALAVAHGVYSARRESRFLALLLARESRHAGIPALLASRCFDTEPRLAFFAATTLDRMLTGRDARAAAAREAVGLIRQALEKGGPEDRSAAARAAENLHHPSLVPALLGVLDDRDGELAESVQRALQELTRQDFGDSARKWRAWWKENANRRRVDWLVDALGHKERNIRQDAQRELNQLTGEYLGYFHDAPKPERDAAMARWRAWVDANKVRLDLP